MQHTEEDIRVCLDGISRFMAKTNQTLAVAESVTSGELQSQLSRATGAMQFFQGGITVYNLAQKVQHLHVDPVHAMSCNCVSSTVASEMAKNVTRLFKCDWGIGITGYASPVPEKNVNDLFAHVSIYHRDQPVSAWTIRAEKQDPAAVRKIYVLEVLAKLAGIVKDYAVAGERDS